MKIDVLNTDGKSTGRTVELPENIFGATPNDHSLYLAVKQYRANQRQGTHKAKERGEIKGSTKKIKRQKGTGTARAGSIKNPLFRGGGRIFGPRPRNYSLRLNKKVHQLARVSALSQKAANGQIKVIEDFTFDAPKTKSLVAILDGITETKKCLLVTGELDKNVHLSGRNIPNAKVLPAQDVYTYAILDSGDVILTESSIDKLKSILG